MQTITTHKLINLKKLQYIDTYEFKVTENYIYTKFLVIFQDTDFKIECKKNSIYNLEHISPFHNKNLRQLRHKIYFNTIHWPD